MKSITETTPIKTYGYGTNFIDVPEHPFIFGRAIESNQEQRNYSGNINILFNKGRYFEATVPKDIINEVSSLVKIDISYDTMIVGSWKQLEDFVISLNCVGYRAKITIDWI